MGQQKVKTQEKLKIKNKQQRQKIFQAIKQDQIKTRHKLRAERRKEELKDESLKIERLANNIPQTIESKRVYDETIGTTKEGDDEFSNYFDGKQPKILITTNINAKKTAYEFADVLLEILPNSNFIKRKKEFKIKEIAGFCSNREYTDLIIINEDKKEIQGLQFIHLPAGPTFYFSISSLVYSERIRGHGRATSHLPELVLNNFQTSMGETVGRLFQSLFPQAPELEGRNVVTLHNQRDYIFFRRHRYVFRNTEKVGLQEIGPQFTMRLRRMQSGIRNEVEWEHSAKMDKEKKKFYL